MKRHLLLMIEERMRILLAVSLIGITLHVMLYLCESNFSDWPITIVLGIGGPVIVLDLLAKALTGQFSSDILAGLSIIISVFLDQHLAGAVVVLMLSGGESIEAYAIETAGRVLSVLEKRAPLIAHLRTRDPNLVHVVKDVPVEQIAIGDILVIFPHEVCPVDGEVVEGNGYMDESFLTGESLLVDKACGSPVISGAYNGGGAITIKATKLAAESRFAQVMQVTREAEQKRPKMGRLADQLGALYTPLAIAIAGLSYLFSGDSERFLAVLMIATPCPLLIAIPVAIMGSVSCCASSGILIKSPLVLEQACQCKTMILDKTGTLTYGRPILTEQVIFDHANKNPKYVLQLVASVERYSKHPLSAAILRRASEEEIMLLHGTHIWERAGEGLRGIVNDREIIVTSRAKMADFLKESSVQSAWALPHQDGAGLECMIIIDGQFCGYYKFQDTVRKDSEEFIHDLLPRHGIKNVMIVSGDRHENVRRLADELGIGEMYAEQSPEQKYGRVIAQTRNSKTIFLGDGINDAPALVAATVGISFGLNSDITSESAGVIILEGSLMKVHELLNISARMRRIALQSAGIGMALSLIGMVFAAFGYIPPLTGAIIQEFIDVFAVLNALRTIWHPSGYNRNQANYKYSGIVKHL